MGSVSKIITLLICFCVQLSAQDGTKMSMQNALLKVAKENKLSLIFNSDNIPDRQISLPQFTSSEDQLEAILNGTDLEYKIESNQIYLFVRRNIYGYIEDAVSGERLIAATIYLPETGGYAVANEQGYFSFTTIEDSLLLEVSYLGYSNLTEVIEDDMMDRAIVFQLEADADLKEVIISDLATSPTDQNYIELNKGTDILLNQNQAVSAIGGEPDIFQAMMRQTGVNAGTDGIGGMHVRGGKNDQNLIMVDGVKLYNSAHAFGAFSIINSGIIDQARLHKAGANGANFGRLSSIMDVKTQDPNLSSVKASAQVSTIATQASLEIPILNDHIGVMLTGRRTHIDPYIRSTTSDSKFENLFSIGETNYHFSDINIKAIAKINAQHKFFVSLYRGQDKYDDNDFIDELDFEGYFEDEVLFYDWQNQFASARYNVLLGAKTIANIQLSRYQYSYENYLEWNFIGDDGVDYIYSRDYREFVSGVTNDEFKVNLQTITDRHHLSYGIVAAKKNYNLGELITEVYLEDFDDTQPWPEADFLELYIIDQFDSYESTIYLADKYKLSNSWLVDGGMYYTMYNSRNTVYIEDDFKGNAVHGYLRTLCQINDHFSLGASVGSYVQTEHLITTSDNGYPNDIWVPSNDTIPPERSNQLEIFADIKSNRHHLKLSSYIKKQSNILFYDTLRTLPSLSDVDTEYLADALSIGTSTAYGLEVNYSYLQKGKFALNAAYTFSKTDYQFKEVNRGDAFPFDYSIPHTFSLGSNVFLSDRWTFSLDWYYTTGKPYTLYNSGIPFSPLNRIAEETLIEPVTDGYNDRRLPDSHKLSFSFSTYWNWGKARSDLSLGIQNVYNRKNVIYQYQLEDEGLQQQLGFSLLPMLRWRVGI